MLSFSFFFILFFLSPYKTLQIQNTQEITIGQNRTKCANVRESPLFPSYVQHKSFFQNVGSQFCLTSSHSLLNYHNRNKISHLPETKNNAVLAFSQLSSSDGSQEGSFTPHQPHTNSPNKQHSFCPPGQQVFYRCRQPTSTVRGSRGFLRSYCWRKWQRKTE